MIFLLFRSHLKNNIKLSVSWRWVTKVSNCLVCFCLLLMGHTNRYGGGQLGHTDRDKGGQLRLTDRDRGGKLGQTDR